MTIFYSSDHHFDHKNIIRFCKRPFNDVPHMNEMLIQYWNETVTPEDTVYYIGDFQFNPDPDLFLSRLNGRKILIKGNHDFHHSKIIESKHWAEVHDILHTSLDHTKVTLCHYAMRVWPSAHKGSLMLYGHSHNRLSGTSQSCDVGVDAWNYRPVTMKELRKRMNTFTPYFDPSHMHDQPKPIS